MYTITKEFSFSASHILCGLGEGHPCSRLHGHNYRVEVELRSTTLVPPGFVRDYRELSPFRDYLEQEVDHRHLNDLFGDQGVTAERLAERFYAWCRALWPEVTAVRVSETDKTWAEYRP
jgi:6-pyruvoyltetrahydropterin/6-carboxytetrahydropterin synthase